MTGEERQLYLGLAAIAATLLATIWLTGAVAGLAFGEGWTSIGLSELVVTALSLPSHLGDPRTAWPRGARSSLPGAPGFYASAVLVFAGICGLVVAGHRFLEVDELLAAAVGGGRRARAGRAAATWRRCGCPPRSGVG